MKTKHEIIADLVPALAQGMLADESQGQDCEYKTDKFAQRVFNFAEALYAEGVRRTRHLPVRRQGPGVAMDRAAFKQKQRRTF